jgi:hypothetical protein
VAWLKARSGRSKLAAAKHRELEADGSRLLIEADELADIGAQLDTA